MAKTCARLERQTGTVFEPHLRSQTTYLPFAAARPIAPHVAGARTNSWACSATWGAAAMLSALRHDVPLLSAWVSSELWLSAGPQQPGVLLPEANEAPQSRAAQVRQFAGAVAMGIAIGVGGTLIGEFMVGSGQARVLDADGIEPNFARLRRLGLLGLLRDQLVQAAQSAHDTECSTRETALLGVALGVQVVIELLRLAIVVPIAVVAAALGAAGGLVGEAFARMRYAAAQWRFDDTAHGRAAEIVSVAQAEELERAALFGVALGDLDDNLVAGPLVGALWNTLHQQSVEVGENLWVEGLVGALGAFQLYRMLHGQQRGMGLLRRANASRALRGTIALAALWRLPSLEPGARLDVPWGMPLEPFVRHAERPWQPPPQGAEAEAYAAGQDVHGLGRDARSRDAVRRLLSLYPEVNVQAELKGLRQMMRAEARRAKPAFRATLHDASRALDDAQLGPYLPIADARNTLNDGEGGAWPVRDIVARIFHATQALSDPNQEDDKLRHERALALIAALASCLEQRRYRVCAPGQVQRLLMVLQGFVEGFMLDDFKLTVSAYITMQYHAFLHRVGEDADAETVQQSFDVIYHEGEKHFANAREREMLATQLRDLANYSHDTQWSAPAEG